MNRFVDNADAEPSDLLPCSTTPSALEAKREGRRGVQDARERRLPVGEQGERHPCAGAEQSQDGAGVVRVGPPPTGAPLSAHFWLCECHARRADPCWNVASAGHGEEVRQAARRPRGLQGDGGDDACGHAHRWVFLEFHLTDAAAQRFLSWWSLRTHIVFFFSFVRKSPPKFIIQK